MKIKKIEEKFYTWLLEKITGDKFYTREQIEAINKFKSCFRIFFEGCYEFDQVYDNHVPIHKFGITNLKFDFSGKNMYIIIVSERPGLLIGKGGETIIALTNYMNKQFDNYTVHIDLKESKLWEKTPIK